MRAGMVAVGDADLAIRPAGAFARHQERGHAGQIGLEGDRQHVAHQLEVLGEVRRHAVGLVHPGVDLDALLLRLLQLAFDLANRREIFLELAAVGRPERRLQLLRVAGDEVQDAAAVACAAVHVFGAQDHAGTEQALEQHARVEHRRQRLRLAAPRQVVGIGAGIARVAVAGLARVVHAELERGEAGFVTDLVGDDLVAGDAGLDVDRGLLDLDAGEVRSGTAAVIAGAVEQRAPAVVGQVADLDHVAAEGFERLEDARQLRGQRPLLRHVPVLHVDAVRHVEERQADGRLGGGGEGGDHRIEEWQRHSGSDTLEEGPARKRLAGDDHSALSFRVHILQRNRFPGTGIRPRPSCPGSGGRMGQGAVRSNRRSASVPSRYFAAAGALVHPRPALTRGRRKPRPPAASPRRVWARCPG